MLTDLASCSFDAARRVHMASVWYGPEDRLDCVASYACRFSERHNGGQGGWVLLGSGWLEPPSCADTALPAIPVPDAKVAAEQCSLLEPLSAEERYNSSAYERERL